MAVARTPLAHCALLGARLRCFILDHPDFDREAKRRIALAACILETGAAPNPFDLLGMITMREIKRRYLEYVMARQGGPTAAAKSLGLDYTTVWRHQKDEDPVPVIQVAPEGRTRVVASEGAKSPSGFSGRHDKSLSRKG